MTVFALGGTTPTLPESDCWVAPTASVIGNVVIEEGVSIWFGTTIRGDNEPIVIRNGTNIQENCVLHTDPGYPLEIGPGCTIGHKAMLHGCTIGANTLIGMNATILNGARVGRDCLVGACSLVTERKSVPDGSLAMGSPAKTVRETSADDRAGIARAAEHYAANAKRFAELLSEAGAYQE